MYIIFEFEFRLDFALISQAKTMPHESGEESRVIIITNDILTIFHNITFVELCRERIKYTSGSRMNLVRTPTLREENQIYSQGTAHQNKLTVTNRARSIRS